LARRPRALAVRRVTSIDDRNRSQFLTLPKVGDDFQGIALFDPDPELSDNFGYFEYFDHWDVKNNSYVPCAGPDCPFCRVGDRPSTRAKTLWFIDDEVKIFTLNWSMINEFSDMLSEEEPVLGYEFKIRRLDDRGKYRISPKSGKMTKKQLGELLGDDNVPDLEDLVTAQLRRALEDSDVAAAMEADDDDDDDADEAPKARRGKAKDEEPEEEAEVLEDETVTITSVSKAKETIKVEGDNLDDELLIYSGKDTEDLKRNMEIVITAAVDNDGDWVLDSWSEVGDEPEEEAEEPEGEGDLPADIADEEFEIVSVDADEETLDVKNDEFEFTLYFLEEGDAADVDFDDYEDGDTVVISAVKDRDGDMVATTIPEKPKPKRSNSRRSSTSKRTGTRAKARK
jgi:hypothetical protein